jgi:hypothetical protein
MRYLLIGIWLLFCSVTSAIAQVSVGVGISMPGVSIGINLPAYPALVRVPGYPVYYAPRLDVNFFFYDGMYWVYEGDNWYASSWYNGPWGLVDPQYVPLYVLRVPVRYYRAPPVYFRSWRADAPPRWGDHWGRDWEQHRSGWDRWNHRSAPAPAPLPVYQRRYSGDRYPQQIEQQQVLRNQNYRYQPRDPAVRQHDQQQRPSGVVAPAVREGRTGAPPERSVTPQQPQRTSPTARSERDFERQPQRLNAPDQRSAAPAQRPPPGSVQREQHAPQQVQRDMSPPTNGRSQQEPNRGQGHGQDKDRNRGEERGQ